MKLRKYQRHRGKHLYSGKHVSRSGRKYSKVTRGVQTASLDRIEEVREQDKKKERNG